MENVSVPKNHDAVKLPTLVAYPSLNNCTYIIHGVTCVTTDDEGDLHSICEMPICQGTLPTHS